MEVCFVQARGQNEFFTELVTALRDELGELGIDSRVATGPFPAAGPDTVYALVPPHEYFALTPPEDRPGRNHLRRTIFLCAEQPGTSFFDANVKLIARSGCPAFDINPRSVRILREQTNTMVEHFQLGWTQSWAHHDPRRQTLTEYEATREIDVLHLGTRSRRRDTVLLEAAPFLGHRECRLVLGDEAGPLTPANPEWVGADEKWNLLGSSRVLLNVHRDFEPYFEWLRVVQAICNGAMVVSDMSLDASPLVPGVHFLDGPPRDLGLIADAVIRDAAWGYRIACDAYEMLAEELPLRTSVEQFADVCGDLLTRRSATIPAAAEPRPEPEIPPRQTFTHAKQAVENVEADPMARIEERINRFFREQKLRISSLAGDVRRLDLTLQSGRPVPSVEFVHSTPAYRGVIPRVSIVTPLYNYESLVESALASAARSDFRDFELIVVNDGSTDDSLDVARRWAHEHPEIPTLLLSHPINRGLGQARNTAIQAARGDYIFMLDADNSVYPHGISRLIHTLETDPGASFAWGYLECHHPDFSPYAILSSYDWDPQRFGNGNYIDAMVLWRRADLLEWGLFTTDASLYGWEDFELFLRVAQAGGRGVMTPQFVARYRHSNGSMLSTANMAQVAMTRQLIEMYPDAMDAR